ncbi:Glutathione S-transferase-1 [Aphelenchoides besseyi]|nr:Glutathione S-transferase-1 [Aphelenchoides besseyi]KAI6236257.1 Glutathione S-transferase-1 [Aphelenchoides besseyi]
MDCKYKLHYFKLRGRGEPIRLMFAYRGVPFEDYQISLEEWPSKKSAYPNGQIPLLEVNGTKVAQSLAIYRYLAKQLNLNGKSDLETFQLDSTAELFRDFIDQSLPYIQFLTGFRSGDKNQLRNDHFLPAVEKFLPQIEKKLREAGSGWFGQSGLSFVDFYIAEANKDLWYRTIRTLNNVEGELLKKFPLIQRHNSDFYKLPELKDYLEKRGQLPF